MNNKEILNILAQVTWFELGVVSCLFFFLLQLEKKWNIQKPRKWIRNTRNFIWQRGFSIFTYLISYIHVAHDYLPLMLAKYTGFVQFFTFKFVIDLLKLIKDIPFFLFGYVLICYLLIKCKRPKDRLIRYNLIFNVVILSIHQLTRDFFYQAMVFFQLNGSLFEANGALVFFSLWMLLILPGFIRSILGQYDTNSFLREAMELHLGRDNYNFIWWNKRKKKN
uniref:Orf221 n=1 Tax=Phaeophyceae sp. TaxID=2249243 RepID=A0A8E5BG97_9PHAE|nr:orf221 [Phaeophyceae sp.]